MRPTFSVLIPTYNSEKIIGATLRSILDQTFSDFELIITDNASTDKTEKVIKSFQEKDQRIKYFKNESNLGYPRNLECARQLAIGKYLYLMGSDDILAQGALQITLDAFKMDKDVGVVTRPYYWFEKDDIDVPVRALLPLNPAKNQIVDIFDGEIEFKKIFESVGQLSGLALKRELVDIPVHPDVFPAHIYPFLSVFKKHKAVYLKDYPVAVRIMTSQTRSLSSIYDLSPTFSWVRMFQTVLKGKKFCKPREWGIDHICRNYAGLIQIKNYARWPLFFRESWLLVKYRPKNLLSLAFWAYFIALTLTPRFILIPLVDYYKQRVLSKKLTGVKLLGKRRYA